MNSDEPMLLEIACDANSSEALQKYCTSEEVKSEEVKPEFKVSQNKQQLFRLCSRVFQTCPTGQHSGNCSHLVNC